MTLYSTLSSWICQLYLVSHIFIDVEKWICRAEIAYKSGQNARAIGFAQKALEKCQEAETKTALRIFIARAYSKMSNYTESNAIYRALIREEVYLPPVIMGLLYNNFRQRSDTKMGRNIGLIKLFVR